MMVVMLVDMKVKWDDTSVDWMVAVWDAMLADWKVEMLVLKLAAALVENLVAYWVGSWGANSAD